MIIDCFPFFNELDLLEVRLNELRDVVDLFVLTESTHTFTGIPKPLYFDENRDSFNEFNIYHNVYVPGDASLAPMEYEVEQKQFNIDRVFDVWWGPGDVLIHGDVDEIPRASVIKKALQEDWNSAGLVMTLFYYYMNCRSTVKKVRRDSRLLRPEKRFKYNVRQNDPVDKLYHDAGWHFSFFGDVTHKLESWGHAEDYNKPPFNDPEYVERCREQGLDLINRKGKRRLTFEFVNDDLSYLPQYVLDNMDRFKEYIK